MRSPSCSAVGSAFWKLGLLLCASLALATVGAAFAGPDLSDDWAARVKEAKFGVLEAIDRGMKIAGSGEMYAAELEPDKGLLVYSLDIVQGEKLRNVVIDAKTGDVVENVLEDVDHSKTVAACRPFGLRSGIETATKKVPGTPFYGRLTVRGGTPSVLVNVVGADGLPKTVIVDGTSAEAPSAEPKGASEAKDRSKDREFTDRFPEEKADLGPTGRNTYFILEPGWYWVLEGTDEGKPMTVTYTTVEATRNIDGVECRAIEVREVRAGELKEITFDYYAISKRTANVYYFGEDVDVYEDGKVVSHEGAWMAGERGCRWGLMVPAVPLIGARHYQEIAPGIAMDRVEIVSTTAEVETPAGKFKDVLKQEETNPEDPGHLDVKYYAPGVGMVKEEADLVLVRYGKTDTASKGARGAPTGVPPQTDSRNEKAQRLMEWINGAIELYYLENRSLPSSLAELMEPSSKTNEPFLKTIPRDPWGEEFEYRIVNLKSREYRITSSGENRMMGDADDVVYRDTRRSK